MQPPTGFDSVVGEPGTNLNFDECIGLSVLWSLCCVTLTLMLLVQSTKCVFFPIISA